MSGGVNGTEHAGAQPAGTRDAFLTSASGAGNSAVINGLRILAGDLSRGIH